MDTHVMNSSLSISTICQDEEHVIGWYLESVAHTAAVMGDKLREVVIVDGGSKDNTIDIINSYKTKAPIKLIERKWDFTRAQMNTGIENCTGDFIFVPDADMSWTYNFPEVFLTGKYDHGTYWDFVMYFTCEDAYHYFNWPIGVNMRMFRSGRKYDETRKYHVHLEGQHHGLPICNDVFIFENSCRIKNEDALKWRGERRQICKDDMALEGAEPGPADRFLGAFKNSASLKVALPPHVKNLVLPSTNG